MNATRTATMLAFAALAACASSQPYPWDYREATFADGRTVMIIGADVADVCEAIADRMCDVDAAVAGCTGRVLERCIPAGGARLEYASDEAYHRDWWACLYAIDRMPGRRWGTTRPRECVGLTAFWLPIPVGPTPTSPDRRDTPPPRFWGRPPAQLERWQPTPIPCVPTLDQCAPTMTCRMRGAHDGRCVIAGTGAAGELCATSADCGYAMHCAQAADGSNRCGVICEVWSPTRCEPGHPCEPYVSDDVGLCVP